MGILERTYGSLKDSTAIGLAKINSSYKDLDVAIIKATNHIDTPPKERYVQKIFSATSALQPRADVAYCIHALAKRLARTRSWMVALKVLIVIHRTLREGDPSFREELVKYSMKLQFLHISNFKDNSSPLAWDYSAWVRAYALFLEERLQCYSILRYDVDREPLTKAIAGAPKTGQTQHLEREALLVQLPALQQLVCRLTGCRPEGLARNSYLIQYALLLVLKDSFKIYCVINDGFSNLVDNFFDMPQHDAAKALSIYQRAGQQGDDLEHFYDFCKGLELSRLYQFPLLKQLPSSFLTVMEEHLRDLRDSPQKSSRLLWIRETPENIKEVADQSTAASELKLKTDDITPPLILLENDQDSLEKEQQDAGIDENNKLEQAVVPTSEYSSETADHILTGWELPLATSPSSNSRLSTDNRMGGGFDKLLLDSLYEDENARRRIELHRTGCSFNKMQNPFDQRAHHHHHPMAVDIAPTTSGMDMGLMMLPQQQHYQQMQHPYQLHPQQQQNSMSYTGPYTQYYPQAQQIPPQQWTSSNPFAEQLPSFPQTLSTLFY